MNIEFENLIINIEDDFDLEKIASSGQCFRVRVFEDGMYRFITENNVIYLKHLQKGMYKIYCSKGSWENIWQDYFDVSRNYKSIRESIKSKNDFVDRAAKAGKGIRILHQNTWEMLVTFIISQRKNIPAISKAVEVLSLKYGKKIITDYETVYAFPTPEELRGATEAELRACGLGYRSPYVRDAVEKVLSKTLDLSEIVTYSDEELYTELQKVHGVGKKVANCVCLFGYGRTARVPVDVWIYRAIEKDFQGKNPFEDFGEEAGIVQQYIFYYERIISRESEEK